MALDNEQVSPECQQHLTHHSPAANLFIVLRIKSMLPPQLARPNVALGWLARPHKTWYIIKVMFLPLFWLPGSSEPNVVTSSSFW